MNDQREQFITLLATYRERYAEWLNGRISDAKWAVTHDAVLAAYDAQQARSETDEATATAAFEAWYRKEHPSMFHLLREKDPEKKGFSMEHPDASQAAYLAGYRAALLGERT